MARKVQAHAVFVLFDNDVGKTARLRTKMRGASMVRRDERGAVVVDNEFARDRGNPPKKDPKP